MSIPSPSGNLPLLVGRERELAVLLQHLDAALAGHGSLMLIGGEAGIGKTTLVETLCCEAADRGALVLVGRSYDLNETPPYGPWSEIFERYRPDDALPPPPPAFTELGTIGAASSQAALFGQVVDFFVAVSRQRTLVLLLDDLHWADPVSLDLLRVVARQLAQVPMLVLATYRIEAMDAPHPLSVLLPVVVREAPTERIALGSLRDDAVRALVDGRYGLAGADTTRLSRYVQQRAEGNPFFIGEVLRSLEEAATLRQDAARWLLDELVDVRVPTLVRQVIGVRIQRLDDDLQRLLAIAAVIGQEVSLTLWQAVAEVDEEYVLAAVERAEAAHLVAGTPDGLRIRFVHALIRETLYDGMTAARRRQWHVRAGELLAAMASTDADAVAYHFTRAGDERAIAWLVRAGEAAHRAYAWLTAAQRYEAALAHFNAGSEASDLQATLHYRVARMLRYSDPAHAIKHMDVVQRIATLRGDRALIAVARSQRGQYQVFAGALEAGISDLAAGTAAMDVLAPTDIIRLTRLEAITIPLQTGRAPLTLQLARSGRIAEAVAIATTIPPTNQVIAADNALEIESPLLGLGIARALIGEPEAAIESFAVVRSGRTAAGDFHGLGFLVLIELRMVALAYQADDRSRRRQLAQEGEQAWANGIGVSSDLPPRFPSLPHLILEGSWNEARQVALVVSESKFAVMRVHAISMLGPLAHAQGDDVFARIQVEALFPDGSATRPGTVPFFEALTLQRLASALALDAGDAATARTWLAAHDAWLTWSGAVLGRADGQIGWARYYRAIGDRTTATHHAQEALVCATDPRQPLVLLAAYRLLGELNTETGRFPDAALCLDQALALADACAAPYERALTLLAIAELRGATGRNREAAELLDEVRAICLPLDAKPVLARADVLAVRLSPPPSATSDGLTARETEVLRLLADGMTIKQIAADLFLSPRTVERHITTIYRKIGARGRIDAAAYAVTNNLVSIPRRDP